MDRPRFNARLAALCVAVGAAAYYTGTGLGTFWPAAWIAPFPALLFAFGSSRRAAAVVAIATYFLGSLGLVAYLGSVIPLALAVALLLLRGALFALAVLAARHAIRGLPSLLAVFAFPTAWVTVEFIESLLSPHGTFLSLAYSQTDVLPLLQLASVTGIAGITFAVTLLPSALAVAWTRRAGAALAPALVLVLVAWGFGSWRLRQPDEARPIRVGMTATDAGAGVVFETKDPAEALSVARSYAERVAQLAAAGADVVILPEKLVGITPADADDVVQTLGQAARSGRVTLVAGLNRIGVSPPRNVAIVFSADGKIEAEYDKHQLLPGPETGYARGSSPGIFHGPGAGWGVAICKDMDFPRWLRRYGQQGIGILAVPAWDFVRDARLHSRMAVVRGVEGGFAVARVATQGYLTFSDAYGRILAERSSDKRPEAVLVGDVPPGPGTTFYARTGDWFAWLNVLALACLLVGRPAGSRQRG